MTSVRRRCLWGPTASCDSVKSETREMVEKRKNKSLGNWRSFIRYVQEFITQGHGLVPERSTDGQQIRSVGQCALCLMNIPQKRQLFVLVFIVCFMVFKFTPQKQAASQSR